MSVYNPLAGLLRTFDTYFVGSFTTREHAAVILFTFLLGGLIGLVQKSGIMEGCVMHVCWGQQATCGKRLSTPIHTVDMQRRTRIHTLHAHHTLLTSDNGRIHVGERFLANFLKSNTLNA